jgi:hypothetical protein
MGSRIASKLAAPWRAVKRNPRKTALAGAAGGAAYLASGDEAEAMDPETYEASRSLSVPSPSQPEPAPSLLDAVRRDRPAPVSLTEEEEERKETAQRTIRDALDAYDQSRSRSDRAQLAETIGNALTKIGAGLHGLKAGVDLSQLDLPKTDFDRIRQLDQKDLDRAIARGEKEEDRVERSVSERRKQADRALERAEDIEARAQMAEWSEMTQRQRDQVRREDEGILRAMKENARLSTEEQKKAIHLHKAIDFKRRAEEERDSEKARQLVANAQQELLKANVRKEALGPVMNEMVKPGFFDRYIRGKTEAVERQRKPGDIDEDEMTRLVFPPAQREEDFSVSPPEPQAQMSPAIRKQVDAARDYVRNSDDVKKAEAVRQRIRSLYGVEI